MASVTAIHVDGMEHGSVDTGSNGPWVSSTGCSIESSIVRSGSYSLKVVRTLAGTQAARVNLDPQAAILCAGFYIRFETLPTGDTDLLRLNNPTKIPFLQYSQGAGGKFALGWHDTAPLGAVGPVLSTGTWYRVVMEADLSANPWVIRCKVDNFAQQQITTAQAAGTNNAIYLGAGTNAFNDAAYTMYIDDFWYSTTNGDYEIATTDSDWTTNGWAIQGLIPTSDGTHDIGASGDFDSFTATAFDNSTTNGYTFIAHRPLQLANTANQVIRQDVVGTAKYMEFLFEDLTSPQTLVADVMGYTAVVESTTTGATQGKVQVLLSDGTEVTFSSGLLFEDDPGTTLTLYKRRADRPSGNWDTTKVNGLKARVGFADGDPDVNFIDLMVQVLMYGPTSGGGGGGEQFMTVIVGV